MQLTKMGFTFVLDRDTGKPLFPVQEVPVPRSTVPGEETAPTQLVPLKPQPLVRQTLTEADLTNITPEARAQALQGLPPLPLRADLHAAEPAGHDHDARTSRRRRVARRQLRSGAQHALRQRQRGADHQQAPAGPRRPGAADRNPVELGRQIYDRTCAACHGAARQGTPPHTPAARRPQAHAAGDRDGHPAGPQRHARVPAVPAWRAQRPRRVPENAADRCRAPGAEPRRPDRYTIDGYPLFLDPHGVPAIAPPWGTLNAIDLVKGDIVWKVPLGEYPQLVAKGIRNTGTLNFGGAVATAGGVIFIAATADEKIRAFEKSSGRVLWEHQLPAGGYATPSVYMIDGRQYVAIAAGGSGKNATKSGDSIIAFALPQADDRGRTAATGPKPGRGRLDRPVRRDDAERLGPHERRPPLHRRGRRHRRPDRRERARA